MRTPSDSGFVGWAFTLAAATLLALAIWPAMADAPMMIKPVAECDKGKCVMAESDYRKWVDFGQRVLKANDEIVTAYRNEQAMTEALRQQLARIARGCGREWQT